MTEENGESWTIPRVGAVVCTIGLVLGAWHTWFSPSPGVVHRPDELYDFIVVGGGTAGAVVAARLSEVAGYKVLLVEAGGEEPWLSHIPLAAPLLQGSRNDWGYKTVPQKRSSGALHNKQSAWPRGKLLGGSGQINYNIHMFGSPVDFDHWVSKYGAQGWDFAEMKKYANKAECRRLRPKLFKGDQCSAEEDVSGPCGTKQGKSGASVRQKQDAVQCYDPPLRTTTSDSELTRALLKAAAELGSPTGNLNDDIDYGAMAAQTTVHKGKRWGTARGYLRPALGRPNLHVLINSQVTRVVTEAGRAIGVQYVPWDNPRFNSTVYARGEILLAAGTINTPVILTHSGIGPAETLAKLQIPVVSARPGVGANLQDHLNLPVYVSLQEPVSLNPVKLRQPHNLWNYFVHGTGDLGRAAIEGVMVTPINASYPEVGLILFNMGAVDKHLYSSVANMDQQYFDKMFPSMDNHSSEGIIFLATCLHPKSRGTIRVTETDPRAPPSIDPNYLNHPYDIACMKDAFKLILKLTHTKAFKSLGAAIHLPRFQECVQKGSSSSYSSTPHSKEDPRGFYNEYVSCLVQTGGITGYHPLGTARMGRPEDPNAVVDPKLKVIGVERLRVVDASAMPTQISGTPNSAIIVLAEKAADLVKADWGNGSSLLGQKLCAQEGCEEKLMKKLSGGASATAAQSPHYFIMISIVLLLRVGVC